jgi:O-antigen/teichoic acid export membrane protein
LIAIALAAEIGVSRISASMEMVMVAHGHTARAGWVRMNTVLVRLLLAAGYFMLLGLGDLTVWIWLVFVQTVLVGAVYVWLGGYLYGKPVWRIYPDELHSSVLFCVTQAARGAQSNLDRMVLSRYADDMVLGQYGAAGRFIQLGQFPIQVVTRILYPKYFVHGANGIAASRRYALRMTPVLLGVGLLAGGMVAAAALLAPTVLGAAYGGSVAMAVGLALSLPLMALQFPPADALTGAGRQGLRAGIYSVAAVGFGFVLLVGTKLGGIKGLIAALLLGHLALLAALWVAVLCCKDDGRDVSVKNR